MTCINSLGQRYKDRSRDQANRATFLEFVEAMSRACALTCIFRDTTPDSVPVFISKKLGPFLDSVIRGLGKGFWSKHKNAGVYEREVLKKFGKCRNAISSGPDVGRHEGDQDADAIAKHIMLRENSAYRLPAGMSYTDLTPSQNDKKKKKSKRKKK